MSEHQQDKARRRRWMKPLLILSLMLNVAVVGMVAGLFLRHVPQGGFSAGPPPLGAFGRPYLSALPADDRKEIRGRLKQEGGARGADRSARLAYYRAAIAALRAEPFAPEMLAEAVSQQAQLSVDMQQRIQAAWLAQVGQMSTDERRAYADGIEEALKRGPGKPQTKP